MTRQFGYYLFFRLKSGVRLLKEAGMIRSLFLLFLIIYAFIALFRIGEGWYRLIAYLLMLGIYHNQRKDKDFLKLHIPDPEGLFQKEYCLYALPFILLELSQQQWLVAILLGLYTFLLPYLKKIRLQGKIIHFPFLHSGSLEYIRMFRQAGALYILLFLFALSGCIHGNVKVAKVCLLLWGIIQAFAYISLPFPLQILHYRSFVAFNHLLWQTNSWNVLVTILPWIFLCFCFSLEWRTGVFLFSTCLATVFYLQGLSLLRFIVHSEVSLFLIQSVSLMPFFFFSCFIPYIHLLFVLVVGVITFVAFNKLRSVWN